MTPSQELELLYAKQIKTVAKGVTNLYGDFIRVSPVAEVNGGSFKAAWDLARKGDLSWSISNNMEYATILYEGRDPQTKKGSNQWPDGGLPMLEKFDRELTRELDKIRV
jgi:hypothetical protein